jgi:dTDP-4-dehydrorhamnose reductase
MKYWLVGAKGMLGQAVAKALYGKSFLATGHEDADLSSLDSLRRCGEEFAPHVILNCAGYTRVDDAEDNEEEAQAINGQGVRNLAIVAQELGSRFLHISTDYVFDGKASSPYSESHACAPEGAYGRSKLAGEKAVNEVLGEKGIIIRTSWLFGPGGNNFVRTMVRLMLNKAELGVVADQKGRPTYTEDLASAMLILSENNSASGVYHFANTDEVSWHAFAETILKLIPEDALCREIKQLQTHEYPTRAVRPSYSVLDTTKISSFVEPRSWQEPLKGYVGSLVKELKESPL